MNKATLIEKIKLRASKCSNKDLVNKLLTDENCFYNMDYDTSYKLLATIGLDKKEINKCILELLRYNNEI